MMQNLFKILIDVSEKAANIARKIREDPILLELLIEEKKEDEGNPRFFHDFKTLADVLIQEMIKDNVGKAFPELKENIQGEESAYFTNNLGQTVCVQIKEDAKSTANVLEKVLDGNKCVAEVLADVIHKETNLPQDEIDIPDIPDIDFSKLGIWIDPIDATSQYIAGDTIFSNFPGITSSGLDCVTILIGVYDIESGNPIGGIINQPFSKKLREKDYKSDIFWGFCWKDIKVNNLKDSDIVKRPTKVGIFSTSEHSDIIETFKNEKYEIAFSAGAGHKTLKVITGEADIYFLSNGTTYKWDTCAPHAILLSQGGCMYDFQISLKQKELIPLKYNASAGRKNEGGVVAVKDINLLTDLLKRLS